MKEFMKLILSGVVSGLIVLGFTWYLSDLRDSLRIGIRVDALEKAQDTTLHKLEDLEQKMNDISVQLARLDERTKYNKTNLNQISKDKAIPQSKVDAAKQYLDTKPSSQDAFNYLETNLGFSAEEAKTVIFRPGHK